MKQTHFFSMNRVYSVLITLAVSSACVLANADKVIIAHRGASGYLPEHTLAAYAMAYAMGADYLEPDLAVTKDGILICLHDMTLEATTDVATVFPDRARENGRWYAVDFTLAEIKQLTVVERSSRRFPQETRLFQIATLEELIQLTQGLNATTGRDVGIYPELKDPIFYERAGHAFSELLLEMLAKYGYTGPDANVYIQCFVPATLKRLRDELGADQPLVQLISDRSMQDALVTDEGLDEIAAYAQGIGPHKSRIEADPTLVERAHARGLVVHPYTFRADVTPDKYASMEDELRVFLSEYNIDGGFVDHTDIMKRVIDELE